LALGFGLWALGNTRIFQTRSLRPEAWSLFTDPKPDPKP